jgi:2-polyprenyl-3-methyl-5-hydroxy-6-metoxy-1,4-benzoquinol methylase
MGKEQPAEYYDKGYLSAAEYLKPLKESRYLKVWQAMADYLDKEVAVIDLGCGVGQTAQMFHDQEFLMYLGVDFSSEAIKKAKEHQLGEDYDFMCSDLFQFMDHLPELGHVQWFCSETLEHITDDLKLLSEIKKRGSGCKISISVPTFDDPAHVRHFKTPMEASLRYSKYIDIKETVKIGAWIVINGTVK